MELDSLKTINNELSFYSYAEIGRTVLPSQKPIRVGTKLRIDGTEKYVIITKVDGYLALFSGENCGGAITKKVDRLWHSTLGLPLVFDMLDGVDFGIR